MTRVSAAIVLSLLGADVASAHETTAVPPNALWPPWNFDPLVVVPLLLALWLYARGVGHLWARAGSGRGVGYAHALSFLLGAAILVLALVSPLDPLGETLLSAHMAQHGLLVTVAPPLLVLGKPEVVFAWALRAGWSRRLLASTAFRTASSLVSAIARPLPAAILHGLVLWFWHAPAAFDAAVARPAVHALEHASFFVTALLFWWAILDARAHRRVGTAIGATFATLMHGGLLGGLITMAPYPLYRWYLGRTELWGWTPLEDQQLAGLLMWVPMGVVYVGTGLVLVGRLMAASGSDRARPAPVERFRA